MRERKDGWFAAGLHQGGRLVVLDPEVAAAFPESAAVKKELIKHLPAATRQSKELV